MLFSHLCVTLKSLNTGILALFWASNCNQVLNMKLFLFLYSILVSK